MTNEAMTMTVLKPSQITTLKKHCISQFNEQEYHF